MSAAMIGFHENGALPNLNSYGDRTSRQRSSPIALKWFASISFGRKGRRFCSRCGAGRSVPVAGVQRSHNSSIGRFYISVIAKRGEASTMIQY